MSNYKNLSYSEKVAIIKGKYSLLDYLRNVCGRDVSPRGSAASPAFRCIVEGHADNNPSCVYYESTDTFHCFSGQCNCSGDLLEAIGKHEGLNKSEALKRAEELAGIDPDERNTRTASASASTPQQNAVPAADNTGIPPKATTLQTAPAKGYRDYFDKVKIDPAKPNPTAKAYLEQRGIWSPSLIERFNIGFDPAWRSPTALKRGKFPPASPRIIIPSGDNFYLARTTKTDLTEDEKHYKKMNEGTPVPFNLEALYNPNKDKVIFITEGAIDALSIMAAVPELGVSAIALNSTNYWKRFTDFLETRKPSANFIFCLDNDEAGRKCFQDMRPILDKLGYNYIKANISGKYNDPNEALTENRSNFQNAIVQAMRRITEGPADVGYYIDTLLLEDIKTFQEGSNRRTGFRTLDDRSGGIYAGLYVIAATTSLGKTTFCHQLADQMAEAGQDVLFFTLEQTPLELVTKSIARQTAINDMTTAKTSLEIRLGDITHEVQEALNTYQARVSGHLSIIKGEFFSSSTYIEDEIRQYIRIHNRRPVVIVDYLQLLSADEDAGEVWGQRQEIDKIMTSFKRMSNRQNVPVFLVSSINRANYQTRINLAALKESGGIEYTADVIWGLQLQILNTDRYKTAKSSEEKEEQMIAAKSEWPRKIELVCLKNRYGPATFSCFFDYYAKYDLFTIDEKGEREYQERIERDRRRAEMARTAERTARL